LARPQAFSQIRLRQIEALSTLAETVGKRQLDIHEPALIRSQCQEIASIADGPPCSFELSSFLSAHRGSLSSES
jgi:hypothetical protein